MGNSYALKYKGVDFRAHPEKYPIGAGEQGVLIAEPYKSEILPHWRFKTPEIAKESAKKIYSLYMNYKNKSDFVGVDMARKFLQMGWTRSRRYANHKSGKKYDDNNQEIKQAADALSSQKAKSAQIFKEYYDKVRTDEIYIEAKEKHKNIYRH